LWTDATAIFKLWDVAPGGTKTLVTRGVYRITAASDPMPAGVLSTELLGNDYALLWGTRSNLRSGQTDAPYLRPDNLLSSITFCGLGS